VAISQRGLSARRAHSRAGTEPIFPRTPACYGFSILAKIIPAGKKFLRICSQRRELRWPGQPDVLAVLKLHYLAWVLFPIKGETYFMYQGNLRLPTFDKYTEDAVAILSPASGLNTVFETLKAFPRNWKSNAPAFIKFVRDHQCPSFPGVRRIPVCECGTKLRKRSNSRRPFFPTCSTRNAIVRREEMPCWSFDEHSTTSC